MCVATSTAISIGVAAGTATAGVYAAHKQGETAQQASQVEQTSNAAQLEYLKQQAADQKARDQAALDENKRQFDAAQATNKGQFDATQAANLKMWQDRENRLAPYRAIGSNATATLANLLGGRLTAPQSSFNAPAIPTVNGVTPPPPSAGGSTAQPNSAMRMPGASPTGAPALTNPGNPNQPMTLADVYRLRFGRTLPGATTPTVSSYAA